MTPDAALFRDAIAADQAYLNAVRAPLEYRPLRKSEERLAALIEERMAHTRKLLEAAS